ncbi:f-box only protein 9 [Caerostris extrusa]|uniref:F-box only protein 9 n=1 Tax=Caerostris extrusa TaxID=172846 RepID=A0AAV4V344_CAEEX|nr:f-box only protein 9 [Caerostris extrusa]
MDNSNCKPTTSSAGRVGSPSENESGTEAQDEPSSSSNVHSELENFRVQWKREIELSPHKEKSSHKVLLNLNDEESVEEEAKTLFLRGVQAEKFGKLEAAISLYRRAIQLVPDIDGNGNCNKFCFTFIDENIEEQVSDKSDSEEESYSDDDDDEDEADNLVNKFKRIAFKTGSSIICQPKHEQNASHMSSLPPEIFLYILKWVVSEDLDIVSLEKLAKVCRGFYLCSRDPEIWHLICLRTWDMNLDNPNKYGSWRNMYMQRPHLNFNGVYISKTTYIRYGESSFRDATYKPCYLVEYFRYLRFFPDGTVLMLTTPDDPYQSILKLRHKKAKDSNVLSGRFKLVGTGLGDNDKLISKIFMTRLFHLELEVKNYKKRINCQLFWNRYSIHMIYKNGQETVSNFDIVPSNFPSFWFSRVKSYTAESERPLE